MLHNTWFNLALCREMCDVKLNHQLMQMFIIKLLAFICWKFNRYTSLTHPQKQMQQMFLPWFEDTCMHT